MLFIDTIVLFVCVDGVYSMLKSVVVCSELGMVSLAHCGGHHWRGSSATDSLVVVL